MAGAGICLFMGAGIWVFFYTGELLLRAAGPVPGGPESLPERGARWRRVEAEQSDDARYGAQRGAGTVQFPVGDRAVVDAEPLSDLALEEAELQPPLTQVVAKGAEGARIGPGERLLSPQGDMAKRQRGDAGQSRRAA
jgi:hypothetical protein